MALFFMHLRWDKPMNAIIFCSTLFFLGLFLIGCYTDAVSTACIGADESEGDSSATADRSAGWATRSHSGPRHAWRDESVGWWSCNHRRFA